MDMVIQQKQEQDNSGQDDLSIGCSVQSLEERITLIVVNYPRK